MTIFEPKDFDRLHQYKMIDGLDLDHPSSMYFFCKEDKMLFIKKSRKIFKLLASCTCGFEPIYRESNLDVIYFGTDLCRTVKMFESYVSRIICI